MHLYSWWNRSSSDKHLSQTFDSASSFTLTRWTKSSEARSNYASLKTLCCLAAFNQNFFSLGLVLLIESLTLFSRFQVLDPAPAATRPSHFRTPTSTSSRLTRWWTRRWRRSSELRSSSGPGSSQSSPPSPSTPKWRPPTAKPMTSSSSVPICSVCSAPASQSCPFPQSPTCSALSSRTRDSLTVVSSFRQLSFCGCPCVVHV